MLDPLELVHLNGRVYDPLVGKFLSGDPYVKDTFNGQNYNRYSYVLNNPTNLTDPTGYSWQDFVPVMGSVESFQEEIRDGNFWTAGAYGAMAIEEGASLGLGSVVKGAVKSLLKSEAKHVAAEQVAKHAAEQAAHATATAAKEAEHVAAKAEEAAKSAEKSGEGVGKAETAQKRGPKTDPDAPHNKTIRETAEKEIADNPGSRIVAGGGKEPERLIETSGGAKEGRRPDIIIRNPDGTERAINVGKTKADGSPVKREAEAMKDLNEKGQMPTKFVPYDKPPPNAK